MVFYDAIPLGAYLAGGSIQGSVVAPGMQAHTKNLIVWAVPRVVSRAAAGFAGAKLSPCRQVREIDQTPTKLTSLIRLYIATYRSEPLCSN